MKVVAAVSQEVEQVISWSEGTKLFLLCLHIPSSSQWSLLDRRSNARKEERAPVQTHTHRLLGKVRLWQTRGELDPSFLVASVRGHEGHLCVGRGCRWVNEGRWWEEALNANVQRRTNSYWPLKNAPFFPHTQLWALMHIYTLLV